MSFIAAAVVAGPALITGITARSAADKQSAATQQANQFQQQAWDQQQKNLAPWQQAGTQALSQMSDPSLSKQFGMSDFQADPSYQFRMAQGQKAIERSAAARGGLQSSGTLQAENKFGQDLASQEYQNAYNRFTGNQQQRFGQLSTLANMGQGAVSGLNQYGANNAQVMGGNVMGSATAQGQADIAVGNAANQGINNLVQLGSSAVGMMGGGAKKPA